MRLYILLFLCSCIAPLSYGCNPLDREALFSISLNFSLPPSTPLNWSSNVDCCLWEGITCDRQGHVTHLLLLSRGIKGSISPSFQKLVHISHLNLSRNRLSGSLSEFFLPSLLNLTVVDLSFNLFSGRLLSSFRLPLSIKTIDLSTNLFTGKVQPSLFEFAPNLTYFKVSNNIFYGPIPLPRCNFSTIIRLLDFSHNQLNGQIPHGLGRCSKLEVFRAGFNLLAGLLPSDIYNVSSLKELSLPQNVFRGPIDDGVGKLLDLTLLELYGNTFSGFLPGSIGKLPNLETLLLYDNNLTGSLPSSLLNCTNLVTLNLRVNRLEGDLSILDFSKLTKLQVLDLGNNNFSKNFPESIYPCKSLTALRLSGNPINGQVSSGILALESLSYLDISNMSLTNISRALIVLSSCKNLRFLILSRSFYNEALPYDFEEIDFGGFYKLEVLVLGGCHLTRQIPFWLAKLRNLKVLDLSFNQLTGTVPSWLANMPNIFYIDFSYNSLSGGIPRELASLASLSSNANILDPSSYMELPLFISVTPQDLTFHFYPAMYLGNNILTGGIPVEIGRMNYLHVLDLSTNNLSGTIPGQISDLKNLEVLDLSNNSLSGEIPTSLEELQFLSKCDVANNNLQGPIPQGGPFATLPPSSFMGNPKLCGFLLDKSCEQSYSNDNDDEQDKVEESEDENFWVYSMAVMGYILGFWVVCGPLLYYEAWRKAFFKYLDDKKDKVHVMVVVYMSRLWRWIKLRWS